VNDGHKHFIFSETSTTFSRPYFSNGRAYGTSCRLSVRPSFVTDALWLKGRL